MMSLNNDQSSRNESDPRHRSHRWTNSAPWLAALALTTIVTVAAILLVVSWWMDGMISKI